MTKQRMYQGYVNYITRQTNDDVHSPLNLVDLDSQADVVRTVLQVYECRWLKIWGRIHSDTGLTHKLKTRVKTDKPD